MYLEFKDNKYNLLDLDYEMFHIVINGIDCEKKRLIDKIAHLTTYLFKDYTTNQKEEFKVQIEYLKEKNDELTKLMASLNEQMENMPLLNKNPQLPSGDNLT